MEIVLHDCKTHYETGETVSGKVRLGPDLRPSHVKVELTGKAIVDWIEMPVTGMYGSVAVSPDLILKEDKCSLVLIHQVIERDAMNCSEIPFEFELSDTGRFASSYQSENASIAYKIIATIVSDGHTFTEVQPLKIFSPLKTRLMVSVANTAEKDFGVVSLASGRIILHANIKRKGYRLGDNIELYCSVWNMSSVECTPRATLYETQVYLCDERQKASHFAITDAVVGDKVDQNIYDKQILSIQIPQEIPLSIKCELIVIKYFIHVTLDIPHAFNIHVNLPFVVTTESAIKMETND